MSASVELVHLRKTFGDAVAIDDLSLTVAAGEFFTLLGSSGSGKTTTLMMIAGFTTPDAANIRSAGARSSTCRPSAATSASCSRTTRCFRT